MNRGDVRELKAGLPGEADATLRLIAALPEPEGLVERVQGAVRADALRGGARVVEWPVRQNAGRGWLRGAAAAAIVSVVAGGAWWIYAGAAGAAGGSAVAAPVHVRPAGGFANAGAMHTPDTVLTDRDQGAGVRDQEKQGTKGQGTRDKGLETTGPREQ
jgi:hypothetical protein